MNYKYCLVVHAKAWLRHCSGCHPRSAARQGWVCLSDIHCSRCPRSWSAAGSPNLCTNLKLRVHQLDNICSSHSKFRFHRCRIDDATGRSLAKKYPKMALFGTNIELKIVSCMGLQLADPLRGKSDTHKPYTRTCLVGHANSGHDFPCSRRCHPRSAARQGWVCLSDIHCSRCPRSWSAADSPNLYTNLKLRVHQLDNICSRSCHSHS